MQVPEYVKKAATRFCRQIANIVPLGKLANLSSYEVLPVQGPAFILKELPITALANNLEGSWQWLCNTETVEAPFIWTVLGAVPDLYQITRCDAPMAAEIASAYARFFRTANQQPMVDRQPGLPDLHNLNAGKKGLETAIEQAPIKKLLKATHVIASLRERVPYLALYNRILSDKKTFPLRWMHGSAGTGNTLFDAETHKAWSVLGIEQVKPGLFFSDLGELLRTVACTEDEDSRVWENVGISQPVYDSLLTTYLQLVKNSLTEEEVKLLPCAGLLVTYLQALLFTTDYLRNAPPTTFNEKDLNLHRAFNQLILLEKMEAVQPFSPDWK